MSANLVFIGFHGSADRSTPESQNELVAALLEEAGYRVRSGSAEQRQLVRFVDQLQLLIRSLQWADVVVACQFSGRRAWTTYFLTRITRRAAIPTVLVLHGGSLPDMAAAHPRRIDGTLRLATRLLAPSSYLQRAFEQRGHRVALMPNLVEVPMGSPDGRQIDDDAPTVLWMRAFHPTYQPDLAMSAFSLLLDRFPQATLTMAGPDRGLLEATRLQAATLGIAAQVTFPGYLEGEQKLEAFRAHDVFLNTTRIDNTPVSVIEAMGAGMPVIATDVGGLRDLARSGEAALLVPDGDPSGLADAVARVIDDPSLAQKLRSNGCAVAARHGPTKVLRSWLPVLGQLGAPLETPARHGCAPLAMSDLDQVTRLHRLAFSDSALTKLGPRVVRRYYRWQFSGPHPDPVAFGAWHDDELVGFVFGGTRRDAVAGFARTSLGTLVAGIAAHPWSFRGVATSKVAAIGSAMLRGKRLRPAVRVADGAEPCDSWPMPTAPSFGILSIAMDEAQRGTGLAGELLDSAERVAREKNFSMMNLSVNASNGRAVRFYERHGWERSSTSPWDGAMIKHLV